MSGDRGSLSGLELRDRLRRSVALLQSLAELGRDLEDLARDLEILERTRAELAEAR